MNLSGYAVVDATNLGVTPVNKEHGLGARGAKIKILAPGFVPKGTHAMFITAPDGNLQATSGVTLGGGTIANDATWEGKWTQLEVTPGAVR